MLESLVRVMLALPMMMATFKEPIVSIFLRGTGQAIGAGNVNVPFFILGDSLLDAGNNNYLNISFKANHWPFGETFFHYSTGRFCDGRIPPDFLAENANLPFIKPYLDPNFSDYTDGANFASGGAGILPQTAPGALYLELQVSFLEELTERLKQQKGDSYALELISRAAYHISIGGDDYAILEKDFLEANTTISPHYKEVFVSWVIGNLTTSIKKMYGLGARKFSFQNVGPIGCMPSSKFLIGTGECWDDANILAEMHNKALSKLLTRFEKELPGFKYALFDYYTTLLDRMVNYTGFGFKEGETACCGSGAYNGNFTCGITSDQFSLCKDPNEFIFFDSAHPTEKANGQLSSLMWRGKPPVVGPYNLKSLFQDL